MSKKKPVYRIFTSLNAFKDDFQLKLFDELGQIKVENLGSITKLITMGGQIKSTGKGWQTCINNALREWLQEHKSV